MTIDLFGEHADRAFPLLSSLVVPRPIAWITTLNELFGPATRRVVQEKYRPIARMGAPSWYCRSGDRFEMEVPG